MENIKIIEAPWTPGDFFYFGSETRSLYFSGPINHKSTGCLISQLLEMNAREPDTPIRLYLNTEGGSLTDSLAVYDVIKTIKCPVYTIAQGLCASGGLIIYLAGEKRYCNENSLFFYHQPLLTPDTITSKEYADGVSEAYTLSKWLMDDKIKKITKIQQSYWDNNFKNKTYKYFTARKAKHWGFVHQIIKNKKE